MSGLSSAVGDVSVEQAFKNAVEKAKKPKKKTPSPVTVRLTDEERAQVLEDAGDLSLSAHIRMCILKKGGLRKSAPNRDYEALARILGQLGQSRIANNLNQLAHHANSGSLLVDEETEKEIRLACAHIAWMRVKLIEALGLREGRRK